jgi:hypothetical protein
MHTIYTTIVITRENTRRLSLPLQSVETAGITQESMSSHPEYPLTIARLFEQLISLLAVATLLSYIPL